MILQLTEHQIERLLFMVRLSLFNDKVNPEHLRDLDLDDLRVYDVVNEQFLKQQRVI